MVNTNFTKNYSRYYDLLYKDKDYASEATYISQIIQSFVPGAKNLIELGCGTGNHAAYLCKDGLEVTGLERSEQMIILSKAKKIKGFEALLADITNFDLKKTFDVAISLFHVISYLNDNESLISCFCNTNKHLVNGGLFIFDVWYAPAVNHLQPTERTKKMEDDAIKVTRHAKPVFHYNENVIDVNYEIIIEDKVNGKTEIYNEIHPMRFFSIPEIQFLATISGFSIVKVEEYLTGTQPGNDTWGVCFILQKNKNV